MKKTFELGKNSAYPKQRGIVNIIGEYPEDAPYVSISFFNDGNQIAHGWVLDKDVELLAVNILKALNSKRVLQGKIPYYKRKNHGNK